MSDAPSPSDPDIGNETDHNEEKASALRWLRRGFMYAAVTLVFYLLSTGPLLWLVARAGEKNQHNRIAEKLLLPMIVADEALTPEYPPLFSDKPEPFVPHREVMFRYWALFGDDTETYFCACRVLYLVGRL